MTFKTILKYKQDISKLSVFKHKWLNTEHWSESPQKFVAFLPFQLKVEQKST